MKSILFHSHVSRHIMNELLNTEEAYVNDLNKCLVEYSQTMMADTRALPGLKDKHQIIFANLAEIHKFHRE